MAKYRSIQTRFWVDPFIISLTPERKLIYIYWLTNPYSTQCGIYELTKRQMAFDTGYNVDTIDKFIEYFQSEGKIKYSESTHEICLINFLKHNSSTSPKIQQCIKRELGEVKNTNLIEYLYSIEAASQEKEKEKEKEKREEEENDSDSPPLSTFTKEIDQEANNEKIEYRLGEYITKDIKPKALFNLLNPIMDITGESINELIKRFAIDFWINKECRGINASKSSKEKYRVINSFKFWVKVEEDYASQGVKITAKQKLDYQDEVNEIFDFYSKKSFRTVSDDAKENLSKKIIKILQDGETKESFKNVIEKGCKVSSMWKEIDNITNRFYDLKKIVTA